MKLNRYGWFADFHRGDGWYVSWLVSRGFFLVAVRPCRWRFCFVRPSGKPGVRRLYVGPIEFELSRYR